MDKKINFLHTCREAAAEAVRHERQDHPRTGCARKRMGNLHACDGTS